MKSVPLRETANIRFMNRIRLLLVMSMIYQTISLSAQTQVIAHRGFWKTEGSAQNSITALIKADSINCYGSEFDVWMTADKKLVVNHDATFKGVNIQSASFEKVTALKLSNGENLPSLEDYFKAAGRTKKSTKLILELKAHKTPAQETEAVAGIVEMVRKYGLESRMEYISFSLHAVKEFIRLAPDSPVYYLSGDLAPTKLKEIGCAGPDYSIRAFKTYPHWIKEAKELGLKVNVWTVNKKRDVEWFIKQGVDFITTDEPVMVQELIK